MLLIRLADHQACVHADDCQPFAVKLHNQLAGGGYDWPASILAFDGIDGYLAAHRTARKRAGHAARLGYRFAQIDRSSHLDEIHAINTSLPERQGRPMTAGYQQRPTFAPLPDYPCPRHAIRTYGVHSPDGTLVAYLVLYLSGDLVMVSQILGHADHMPNDVMYLLVTEALRVTPTPSTVFYNRWDSGTAGLVYFKTRLGFAAERVDWRIQ